MNENIKVNKEAIIRDFEEAVKGALDDGAIQAVKDGISSETNGAYRVQGSIASMIFYTRLNVTTDENSFTGNAGGIGSLGGGGFWGTLFTDDLQRLYRETTAFQYNSTLVYFNVNFFNSKSQFLGHMHAGAVSTVSGIGGGSGQWDKK